jgi:hypothetical protein
MDRLKAALLLRQSGSVRVAARHDDQHVGAIVAHKRNIA